MASHSRAMWCLPAEISHTLLHVATNSDTRIPCFTLPVKLLSNPCMNLRLCRCRSFRCRCSMVLPAVTTAAMPQRPLLLAPLPPATFPSWSSFWHSRRGWMSSTVPAASVGLEEG